MTIYDVLLATLALYALATLLLAHILGWLGKIKKESLARTEARKAKP